MRALTRGTAPHCLTNYRHGVNNWSNVTPEDKAAIWLALDAMQGRRCAYCEADISQVPKHIEHFRQKSQEPKRTFEWENLFGSCNRSNSCGMHKDQCRPLYDGADLIKPDRDDPDQYFVFVSDGTIHVRAGLTPPQLHRAQETLRIFNLNARHGALRSMRQQAVQRYCSTGEDAQKMFESGEVSLQDCFAMLEDEVRATADLPFSTAIRHTLLPSAK